MYIRIHERCSSAGLVRRADFKAMPVTNIVLLSLFFFLYFFFTIFSFEEMGRELFFWDGCVRLGRSPVGSFNMGTTQAKALRTTRYCTFRIIHIFFFIFFVLFIFIVVCASVVRVFVIYTAWRRERRDRKERRINDFWFTGAIGMCGQAAM